MSGTRAEKSNFTWDYLGLGDNSPCPNALVLFFDERRRTSPSSLQSKEGLDEFECIKVQPTERWRVRSCICTFGGCEEDPDAKGIPVHCLQTRKEPTCLFTGALGRVDGKGHFAPNGRNQVASALITPLQRCDLDLKGSKGRYADWLDSKVGLKSTDRCSVLTGPWTGTLDHPRSYLTKTGPPAIMLLATFCCIIY